MDSIQQLNWSHGESLPCPFPSTTAAFYHQALTNPDIIAVRDRSGVSLQQFTYRELAANVQHVARQLQAAGVQPSQRVPLVMKRGVEMIVGIFAILSCGAQYVPLDGSVVTDSTLTHVVEECDNPLIVCIPSSKKRVDLLFPGVKTFVIDSISPDSAVFSNSHLDLATSKSGCYVIYTSGSSLILFLLHACAYRCRK